MSEQIIAINKKNDFFGEMALLDGRTAPATVIAHEDAVIGLISKDDFDRLVCAVKNGDVNKSVLMDYMKMVSGKTE